LRNDGASENVLRDGYAAGLGHAGETSNRLAWVEGIVTLFGDKDWAVEEYDRLSGELEDIMERSRLESSRRQHLEPRFY
jgi:hypothetical protein